MRALGFLSSLMAPNESIITKLLQGFFLQPIKMTHFSESEVESNFCMSLLSLTYTWCKHLFLVLNEGTEFLIIQGCD